MRFIEVSGANKCDTLEQLTENIGDLQAFPVWLLFELWSDRKAAVTHMDLSYAWPESQPAELAVIVGTDPASCPSTRTTDFCSHWCWPRAKRCACASTAAS